MTDETGRVVCPLCGGEAESGAMYSRSALAWLSGKPDLKHRFKAGFLLAGEMIGEVGLFLASHATGIYCRQCRRIILEAPETPRKYYPDLRE